MRDRPAAGTPRRPAPPQMSTVILSPHLDDAVLSCWHVLTRPGEVGVINVFAGVPSSLDQPAWWDSYTGASDSSQRVRERIAEDRRALALAGRTAVNLDLLDEQYRTAEQPLEPLVKLIERWLTPSVRIYAPAAFTNHADHGVVRAAALRLRSRGFSLSLYADLPHATAHGWPAWVTGSQASDNDLAAVLWDGALATTGIAPQAMAPSVHALEAEAHAHKLGAVHAYATQLTGLADYVGRDLADRDVLGYEVEWELPSRITASPARESANSPSHP